MRLAAAVAASTIIWHAAAHLGPEQHSPSAAQLQLGFHLRSLLAAQAKCVVKPLGRGLSLLHQSPHLWESAGSGTPGTHGMWTLLLSVQGVARRL